jgi:hypothetical protein
MFQRLRLGCGHAFRIVKLMMSLLPVVRDVICHHIPKASISVYPGGFSLVTRIYEADIIEHRGRECGQFICAYRVQDV